MSLPTELKFDTTVLNRIPILVGQSNFSIWAKKIQSTLMTYSVWEIIDGSIRWQDVATFHAAITAATGPLVVAAAPAYYTAMAESNRWLQHDRKICRFLGTIIGDHLQQYIDFNWENQVTYPSVTKKVLDTLTLLFGSTGLSGQFLKFHQLTHMHIRTKHATEDMAQIASLFEDMHSAGLNLQEDFKAMLLLTRLPDDYFQFSSTLVQTVAEPDFTCDLVTARITAELNMRSSRSLSSRISEVQVSEHSANRTIAIR